MSHKPTLTHYRGYEYRIKMERPIWDNRRTGELIENGEVIHTVSLALDDETVFREFDQVIDQREKAA